MGWSRVWVLCVMLCFGGFSAGAQSQEVQQLLLNVEKLSQLKNILSDMKRGYEVVSKGYNTVKSIAQGNFSLHEVFLDGLWLVSPEVRKYYKIAEIIAYQKDLVSEYKTAYKRFSGSGNFSVSELDYFSKVYSNLLSGSMDNLDQLATVIASNKLRMSDDERLQVIDWVFDAVQDKLVFLRSFNRKAGLLGLQREREKTDIRGLGDYFQNN